MITPNMTDDEKRTVLMDMTYEDLEIEIISGRLTWQEFDRLLPEIGAAIGATVMFENTVAPKPPLYGVSETSAPYTPLRKPTKYGGSATLERPKEGLHDTEAVKLRQAVEKLLKAQDTTNELLADILKELRRR